MINLVDRIHFHESRPAGRGGAADRPTQRHLRSMASPRGGGLVGAQTPSNIRKGDEGLYTIPMTALLRAQRELGVYADHLDRATRTAEVYLHPEDVAALEGMNIHPRPLREVVRAVLCVGGGALVGCGVMRCDAMRCDAM